MFEESFRFTTATFTLVATVLFYFLIVFVISTYEEMTRIENNTRHYNLCQEEEFERKLAEIMIQLQLVEDYNYYAISNKFLIPLAHKYYPLSFHLRNMCYRCGIKNRLEKQFYVMSTSQKEDDDDE